MLPCLGSLRLADFLFPALPAGLVGPVGMTAGDFFVTGGLEISQMCLKQLRVGAKHKRNATCAKNQTG